MKWQGVLMVLMAGYENSKHKTTSFQLNSLPGDFFDPFTILRTNYKAVF